MKSEETVKVRRIWPNSNTVMMIYKENNEMELMDF